MEISAIMNIHELAVNRTVKQRSEAQVKREEEVVYDDLVGAAQSDVKCKGLIGVMTDPVQQEAEKKGEAQSELPVTGGIVDIHT